MNAFAVWLRESFHEPWALLLLPLVVLIWARRIFRARPVAVRYSSTEFVETARPTLAIRFQSLPRLLRTLAVLILMICLAQPRKGNQQSRIKAEGIAIQLLVDRSGSMRALDLSPRGRRIDRFSTVKMVVKEFVSGGAGLRGRDDDLIGAIVFARDADSVCPLTLDHSYLLDALDKTEIAKTQQEDGTAIGDALALAIERLKTLEQQRGLAGDQRVKSKIVILLTDGENNSGDIEPLKAAEIAATYGIKVYTIGAGTRGMAEVIVTDPFTRREVVQRMPVSIDEDTLRKIADMTKGRYFRATDADSLKNIYVTIDKLEKTKTEERRFMEYKELATEWVPLGPVRCPPLLLVAGLLIVLEILLTQTWLRRIP